MSMRKAIAGNTGKKKWILMGLAAAVILMAGCGSRNTDTLIVGTTGQLAKYTEIGEDGKLQGFEIDTWNEISRRIGLPVEYRTGMLTGLWGMLDSGTVVSIANPTARTKERAEKYLFTDPYNYDPYVLVTKKGAGGGSGIQSFSGRRVCVAAGTNMALVLDRWNESHGNPLQTGYPDDEAALLPAVMNGTYDAAFMLRSGAEIAANGLKMDIDIYDADIPVLPAEYAFRKDEKGKRLCEKVNQALADMKKDGTLQKLSFKWFGTDLTREPGQD